MFANFFIYTWYGFWEKRSKNYFLFPYFRHLFVSWLLMTIVYTEPFFVFGEEFPQFRLQKYPWKNQNMRWHSIFAIQKKPQQDLCKLTTLLFSFTRLLLAISFSLSRFSLVGVDACIKLTSGEERYGNLSLSIGVDVFSDLNFLVFDDRGTKKNWIY